MLLSKVSRGVARAARPLARAVVGRVAQPRLATSVTFKRTFFGDKSEDPVADEEGDEEGDYEEGDGYTEEYDPEVYKQSKRGITINGVYGQYAHALADGCDLTNVDKAECYSSLAAWVDASSASELKMFLSDPSLSFDEKKSYLEKEVFNATDDGVTPYDDVSQEMILMLLEDNDLNKLPEIMIAFQQLIDDATGEVPCVITSADELTSAQMDQVEKKCASLLKAGQTLRTEYWIDPEILGGLVVELGAYAQDLSAKTAITKAEQAMMVA